jgi:hypothetical protein
VKSRRKIWVGHIARTGKKRNIYRILVEKTKGNRYWIDLGIDGNTILIFKN